jgi:arsenate reductase (thioredoxin)
MTQKTIIFVCEHGAAKSIIAASYFNKLANEKGLKFTAIARGTNPDETLSPITVQGLQKDGVAITETQPKKITIEEIKSAHLLVTFCNISDEEVQHANEIEHWRGIPPVSENYEIARDFIKSNLNQIIEELTD